jgi:hypothetical protein
VIAPTVLNLVLLDGGTRAVSARVGTMVLPVMSACIGWTCWFTVRSTLLEELLLRGCLKHVLHERLDGATGLTRHAQVRGADQHVGRGSEVHLPLEASGQRMSRGSAAMADDARCRA